MSIEKWAAWALAEQSKPWRKWFAWRPVKDLDTGRLFWLETIWFKYRWDGSGARYYYRPLKQVRLGSR